MPIKSRWFTPIPRMSLPTWVFGSESFCKDGDKTIFVDASNPKRVLTFSAFQQYSKRLALGFRRLGVQPGDRVLIFCENDIFIPCMFFGVIMAGAIFTGASPSSTVPELTNQLQDSGATALIASTSLMDIATEASRSVGLPPDRLFNFDLGDTLERIAAHYGGRSWTALLASANDAQDFKWFEPSEPEHTICCLNYSSGTTGRPKGVEVTHFSYVANGEAHLILHQLQQEAWDQSYNSRALCFLPLNHVAAQTTFMANCPKMGVESYIMPKYDFGSMIQHIKKFQITDLMTAPPVISSLVANSANIGDSLVSVRNVICGTAPLPPSLARRANKLWADDRVVVRQGWGMTELTCLGTMNDPRLVGSPDSVGEAAPNSAIKLMDGSTEITDANKQGELWFSGPTLMTGYWKNPQATHDTVVDQEGTHWLKTGDIAYVDSWGPGANIYIVDRAKEIFKVKGYQVSPAELEAILATHPDIIDSAVVGIVVEGREVPRAYVVKRPGSNTTSHAISSWMDGKVAAYKRLLGGVVFVDIIPRTQSGKILRRLLRDRAKAESDDLMPVKAKLS
ncbi:Acyl-CoA ligase azaF [Fusarium oxysporum f. sp. rapae]|uniref:Acyl-CoA ligase azaF n=1 Tax=Fusarium oxysporum f. sp. rapae TaxID=485398 RepID=A0A8J5TLR5_FUSOX|nr:Acyl-CoA ligase azaF [Fusarium oxysporum f. sp. rapae]